ncbi:MAG: V-type ATP synthase subunit F [Clostridiales bacterium]|jgi:V/A-type H+-transporting ATPase subunit F|nr:V-type ATP synthase subunit F [Clostridiales bacterium]
MRIFLLSDNVDTLTGMRLVGVDGALTHTREELAAELEKVLRARDVGVLAISEKIFNANQDLLAPVMDMRGKALIVAIPDRHGTSRQKDFLSHYVREAIGVKL